MNVTLELDEAASEVLAELQTLTGLSLSRIFSCALSVLLWAVKQGMSGRIVASMNESERSYRELDLSALKQKRRRAA